MRWTVAILAVLLLSPVAARADVWTLGDWCLRNDGISCQGDPIPGVINTAAFDFATGLGSVTIQFSTPGAHVGGVYFQHYYDAGYGDLSTAYGNASGAPAAGVSWGMAWPGDLFGVPTLYDQFASNSLTNTSSVPAYIAPPNACCTVAMAMLHEFDVPAGYRATLTYTVGDTAPGGFFLNETDHDFGAALYLSERFSLSPNGPEVPEPAAIWLLLTAGAGTLWARRRARG